MSARLRILRAGPLATVQDAGRHGKLAVGVSASGPMDRTGWRCAGADQFASSGIELTSAGLEFEIVRGQLRMATGGSDMTISINGSEMSWPANVELSVGDMVSLTGGHWGNFAYLRFDHEIDLPSVLGSVSTNMAVKLGGLEGRALQTGDELGFSDAHCARAKAWTPQGPSEADVDAPIRFIWGLHADQLSQNTREKFLSQTFAISPQMNRMGFRLNEHGGILSNTELRTLVSDAVVPGDIQILGDGTPIILMRDHQPTGGYPRIATIITADLDRVAQMRPGTPVRFAPVTLKTAINELRTSQRARND